MKLKNSFIALIISSSLSLFITGCSIPGYQKNIYNDDSKIAQQGDSFSYNSRIGSSEDKYKQDIKYSGFYGDETLWSISAKETSNITFQYTNKLNSGEFKVVLIDSNMNVKTLFSGSKEDKNTIKLSKGDYRLKIVGKNAKGQLQLSINKDSNIEISKQEES